MEETSKNPIQVSEKLFQVIETLADNGPMGIMELSAVLGFHKSTTHRLVTSLQCLGYVRQEEDSLKYALSLRFLQLGSKIIKQTNVATLIHPLLRKISEQVGETVHLMRREGNDAVYIDKVESGQGSIRMASRVGNRIPLYCSGVGKALLAEMEDEEIEEDEKLSDKAMNIIMGIVMVLSLVLAVGLFVFLPKWIVNFADFLTVNRFVRSLAEGIIKIAIFIGYLGFTVVMKDVRRTYEYHGAEHKTIACFEAGLELTVENVKKQVRFHPRCGTSFIFITLFISILVMCLVPFTVVWQRMLSSIILLPLMVGISYELIRIAGRHDNLFTRILSAPGLYIQRLTTREPDDKQIECAIAAMKPCIPEDLEEDKW